MKEPDVSPTPSSRAPEAEATVAGGSPGPVSSIASHLPAPPGRLLVGSAADADTEELRRGFADLGYRVEVLGGTPAAPDGAKVDGIVLRIGEEPPGAFLADLRSRIADQGRLLLLLPGEVEPRDEDPVSTALPDSVVRALYESRWVVLDRVDLARVASDRPAPLVLVARPGDHRIRPFREGDEAGILDLFESAFHRRRSLERWRWAYESDPWGSGRISLAEERDGRLAAHYAGYPIPFWSELDGAGREVLAHHVGDTMTSPEARRVGRGRTNLLTRTVEHFYATWCRGRIAFNYGTNTGKIQRFSRRTAGARRVEPIPFRTRSLDEPFPTLPAWRRRLGGWRVERVDAGDLDEPWDELFRRVRSAYGFLVARDRRYLSWRYRCPGVEHRLWAVFRRRELVGWSVLLREEDRLVWGDALFDPRRPAAAAILLAAAAGAEENRGCRTIEGWFPDRPAWWAGVLRDLGFRAGPEPQDLGLVYVPFEEDPGDAMAEHLYYTKGDFDLF